MNFTAVKAIYTFEMARFGRYPEGIAADVSPERLQRFFTHEDEAYQVVKDIRETIVFAPHNLLVDPPFSQIDLLSCRTLLIYLDSNAQPGNRWARAGVSACDEGDSDQNEQVDEDERGVYGTSRGGHGTSGGRSSPG